jgi:GDP-D-mannose 3', 5'-epimerase
MKICVTGGAGMIGASLIRKLVLNHKIVVIDNLWRGRKENITDIKNFNLENDFYNIDLSNNKEQEKLINVLKNVDTVIHLADIVAGIGFVFNNQYDVFHINNAINTNVFNACLKADVKKIIYANTACAFPKDLQAGLDSILREDQLFPAEPESAYGWSKLMGTLELRYLKEKSDIDVCSLFLHNVYGPYCDIDPERSQVIPAIIMKILEIDEGGTLQVWGSGNQGRAFIYVDDVVDAFIRAVNKNNLPEIIQIGPDKCTSIKELTLKLKDDVIKKEIEIFYDMSKPEGDKGRAADYSLAKKALGWEPAVSLEEGLKKTTKWILKTIGR